MYDTVEDLTSAVTGVLHPDGPYGVLTKTLTDALDSVWAAFFASPVPPGSTNWNAYTHDQLYRMLWDDADVGDVSTVAAEWGRHSAALTGSADALHGHGQTMRSNWDGQAADLATGRLAELADRVWNAGARAGTVQKAAAEAADALALARNTMPTPLPDPMTLVLSAIGLGPVPPLQAVAIGAARIFTADAVAGASKAEAVRVMQRYEASLRASGNQIVPGRPEDTRPRKYDASGATSAASATGGTSGGVPWSQLVGGAPPGSGGLVGAGPLPGSGGPGAPGAALSATGGARGPGGFFPPMGMGMWPGDSEQQRRRGNNLPNVDDNRLFAVDDRASAPVIGDVTDKERSLEL